MKQPTLSSHPAHTGPEPKTGRARCKLAQAGLAYKHEAQSQARPGQKPAMEFMVEQRQHARHSEAVEEEKGRATAVGAHRGLNWSAGRRRKEAKAVRHRHPQWWWREHGGEHMVRGLRRGRG
jgi:hypothetical protein